MGNKKKKKKPTEAKTNLKKWLPQAIVGLILSIIGELITEYFKRKLF